MKKILLVICILIFSCVNTSAEQKVEFTEITPYSFAYKDVLIEAECSDGGGVARAIRGTVKTSARMVSIEYYLSNHKPPLSGYWIRSRCWDFEGIGYIFALEGYTEAYETSEYNPSYCKVW